MQTSKETSPFYGIGYNLPGMAGMYKNDNAPLNEKAATRMAELLNDLWGTDTHWIVPLNYFKENDNDESISGNVALR